MDLFNKKLVKQLKEENERLLCMVAQPVPTITVHKGDVEQFTSRVRLERDAPIDIVKEYLARQIVDELIKHELIDYDVEYDVPTMTDYITARIFVGRRG